MVPNPTTYDMVGRTQYMRRDTGSTLLFSMAKRLALAERDGCVAEYFFGYLTGDGDFKGFVLIDTGDE